MTTMKAQVDVFTRGISKLPCISLDPGTLYICDSTSYACRSRFQYFAHSWGLHANLAAQKKAVPHKVRAPEKKIMWSKCAGWP